MDGWMDGWMDANGGPTASTQQTNVVDVCPKCHWFPLNDRVDAQR